MPNRSVFEKNKWEYINNKTMTSYIAQHRQLNYPNLFLRT